MSVRTTYYSKLLQLDPDAEAYLDCLEANGFDNAQSVALYNKSLVEVKIFVNTMVENFKSSGVWEDFRGVFPMIGGTAATHACNLIDPSTPGTFFGAVNHDADGPSSDGLTGYLDMNVNPVDDLGMTMANMEFDVYINTSDNSLGGMGIDFNGGVLQYRCIPRIPGFNLFQWTMGSTPGLTANTDSRGFWSAIRTASTVGGGFKNGVLVGLLFGTAAGADVSGNLYGMATNDGGTPKFFGNRPHQWLSFGLPNAPNLMYPEVQALQVALNRAA